MPTLWTSPKWRTSRVYLQMVFHYPGTITWKRDYRTGRRTVKGVKWIREWVQTSPRQCLHVSSRYNLGILDKAVIFKSCCKLAIFMLISLNEYYCWRRHRHLFALLWPKTLKTPLYKKFYFDSGYLHQKPSVTVMGAGGTRRCAVRASWTMRVWSTQNPISCSSTKWPSKRRCLMNTTL